MAESDNSLVRDVYDRFLAELAREPGIDPALLDGIRTLLRAGDLGSDLSLVDLYEHCAAAER